MYCTGISAGNWIGPSVAAQEEVGALRRFEDTTFCCFVFEAADAACFRLSRFVFPAGGRTGAMLLRRDYNKERGEETQFSEREKEIVQSR